MGKNFREFLNEFLNDTIAIPRGAFAPKNKEKYLGSPYPHYLLKFVIAVLLC